MTNPGITGTDLRDWVAKIVYTDGIYNYVSGEEKGTAVPTDEELRFWAKYSFHAADIFCSARTVKHEPSGDETL